MKSSFIPRTITGVLFIAVIIGSILYNTVSFSSIFAAVTALTIHEFVGLINETKKVHVNKLITMAGGIYLFFAFGGYCSNMIGSRIFLPYLLILMYLLISELYLNQENPISNWTYSIFTQIYIALPLALLNVLYYQTAQGITTINAILPLSVFIFLWTSDTGAYCIGSMIGKHRLFERISPKKSWEGSIGGGVLAIMAAVILAHFFPFMNILQWIGLATVIVIFGTWGDLIESLLKRKLGVKDSGNILPGHGGFLDRFDSALLAIPAAVCYLYLISA